VKRISLICLVCAVAPLAGAVPVRAHLDSELYIGTSETEFPDGHLPSFQGERTLYVWYGIWDIFDTWEFGLTSTGLEIVEVRGAPGFRNDGTTIGPVIVADPRECVDAAYAVVIAEIIVRDATGAGGSVCFTPSPETGRLCASSCDAVGRNWWHLEYGYGIRSEGLPYCAQPATGDCLPAPVDRSTWGGVKAHYR
jgi:hypothetical protein